MTVDETGVDETVVDEMVVDEPGINRCRTYKVDGRNTRVDR